MDDDDTTWFEDTRISLAKMRLVWAIVTAHPDWSINQIAVAGGMHKSGAALALRYLAAAGYIALTPHTARTVQIIIPFVADYHAMPRTDGRRRTVTEEARP